MNRISANQTKVDDSAQYDVIVVGCGGWGLAALKVLSDIGLRVLGIERKEICNNLRHYMKNMLMHSYLSYMVLDPEDPILAREGNEYHPRIEELIRSYSDFAQKFNLPIKTHHELVDIEGAKDDFLLSVRDGEGRTSCLKAKRVVLATGSYDEPNLAGIPGELNGSVQHYFHEWEHISDQRVLFMGGGFSSADGIVALCPRNTILWVVRKSKDAVDEMLHLQKTKWGQHDARLVNTEILTESQVVSLEDNTAVVQTPDGQKTWNYDLCYMLIGHRPAQDLYTRLLNGNLEFDEETFESCERPGLYLVGALAKKHLEHIGLTHNLCPDNEGVRYIDNIRSAMQKEFNRNCQQTN